MVAPGVQKIHGRATAEPGNQPISPAVRRLKGVRRNLIYPQFTLLLAQHHLFFNFSTVFNLLLSLLSLFRRVCFGSGQQLLRIGEVRKLAALFCCPLHVFGNPPLIVHGVR